MLYKLLLLVISPCILLTLNLPKISAQAEVDVAVTDPGPLLFVTPGTYPVIPTVLNNDLDYSISSLNANWQLDGGTIYSCEVNEFTLYGGDLYPTFKARMVLEDSVTFTEPGSHVLKIWTDTPGGFPDTDPANDTAWLTITVCDSLPEKNVLVWYGTHTECFPCGGYGEYMIDSIHEYFPDNAILIRAHDLDTDPYVCDASTAINETYIWPYTGHPAWVFDQFAFPYFHDIVPFELYYIQWLGVAFRMDYTYPVAITITDAEVDTATQILHAKINAEFYADYNGPLTINCLLTEDSIYGPQSGAVGGYIYHTQVLRAMTGGIEGIAGIIPDEVSAGEIFTLEIEQPLDPDWNQDQIYLSGYVMIDDADPLKRHILNSERIQITDFIIEPEDTTQVSIQDLNPGEIRIYPNPASDKLYCDQINENAEYELMNSAGQRIILFANKNYLDISSLSAGIYLLKIENQWVQFMKH